jgi:hypothetical protein
MTVWLTSVMVAEIGSQPLGTPRQASVPATDGEHCVSPGVPLNSAICQLATRRAESRAPRIVHVVRRTNKLREDREGAGANVASV